MLGTIEKPPVRCDQLEGGRWLGTCSPWFPDLSVGGSTEAEAKTRAEAEVSRRIAAYRGALQAEVPFVTVTVRSRYVEGLEVEGFDPVQAVQRFHDGARKMLAEHVTQGGQKPMLRHFSLQPIEGGGWRAICEVWPDLWAQATGRTLEEAALNGERELRLTVEREAAFRTPPAWLDWQERQPVETSDRVEVAA